jgi:hypothetical protein
LSNQRVDLRNAAHVGHHQDAAPVDRLESLVRAHFIDLGNCDVRAFAGKAPCDRAAHPASRSGNDCDLVFEFHGRISCDVT